MITNINQGTRHEPVPTSASALVHFHMGKAANDTIEETSNWNSEARAIADDGFRAAGVVTVSEIIRRYSTSYKRIVKRGFIKNETEYYVISAILVNQGSAISDDERACLQRLTEAFEEKA